MLEEIRQACRRVAQQAAQVTIVEERVGPYARELAEQPLERLQMDPRTHFLHRGEETVAFFLTLDTINFGSGYFPALIKPPDQSGYFTIAGALTERFRTRGAFSARQLAELTPTDCARLFGQEAGGPAALELMSLFADALRELGEGLLTQFDGRFSGILDAAENSAGKLTALLARFPSYRDTATYRGEEVPFYKRAQIAAADLHIAFGGEGAGRFNDIDRLTIFADNLVPHVLREDGLLRYGEDLAARIAAGAPLAAGGAEEVEIRACAVEAAERLLDELHRGGRPVNALQLDNFLWHRGQQAAYRATPRHRTLTRSY